MKISILNESPAVDDVVALLETHLAFSRRASPPGHVHALDLDGLMTSDITFCAARCDGELLGVGAIRMLGHQRAEIKSMHTAVSARGRGVARQMLEHLMDVARHAGVSWLGLETGSMEEFLPARRLYTSAGFRECAPFGDYTVTPHSVCMSIDLSLTS